LTLEIIGKPSVMLLEPFLLKNYAKDVFELEVTTRLIQAVKFIDRLNDLLLGASN
jgi:hypothetical protein